MAQSIINIIRSKAGINYKIKSVVEIEQLFEEIKSRSIVLDSFLDTRIRMTIKTSDLLLHYNYCYKKYFSTLPRKHNTGFIKVGIRKRGSNLPKYKRPEFEDVNTYVSQLQDYFETHYQGETIYKSDIDMAINRFKLKDNPECWKIKEILKRYISLHNDGDFISKLKGDIVKEKKSVPLEEKFFSWDNIAFCDYRIEIRDEDHIVIATYRIESSRSAFNSIKTHFKIKFPNLEIQVKNGKLVFNDEKRFLELLSSINIGNKSSIVPDLVKTPKSFVFKYFYDASNEEIRNHIFHLKQPYLSYLCTKHIDKYRIKYTTEQRINMENEYIENAFLFTISESKFYNVIVYENTEDDRSSIVFFVNKDEYEKAVNNICGYFSSRELNKRETLASYYVNFKDSGIKRFQRIYHTDYNQWKKTIDSFHYRK